MDFTSGYFRVVTHSCYRALKGAMQSILILSAARAGQGKIMIVIANRQSLIRHLK